MWSWPGPPSRRCCSSTPDCPGSSSSTTRRSPTPIRTGTRAPRRRAGAAVIDLSRLLAPRSVAVVGATERPAAYGSEALLNLARWGFDGRVYAVNPNRERVHGIACQPTLSDLPEPPDAVIVAVAAEVAPDVV